MSRVPNGSEAGSTTGLFRDDTVAVPRVSIDWDVPFHGGGCFPNRCRFHGALLI